MTVPNISSLGATDATSAAAAEVGSTTRPNQFGKDTFLKLLVAQMKYQNPMEPADSSQMMAQTAQFTMVERLEELAKQNTEMLSSQRMLTGSSLMGRQVTYTDLAGKESSGLVSGVKVTADGPVLTVNNTDVAMATIKSVAPAPAPAAATPAAPVTKTV